MRIVIDMQGAFTRYAMTNIIDISVACECCCISVKIITL